MAKRNALKVECILNSNISHWLTIGKVYSGHQTARGLIELETDKGALGTFFISNFKILEGEVQK